MSVAVFGRIRHRSPCCVRWTWFTHTFVSCLFKICFNIILISKPRYLKRSLQVFNQNSGWILTSPAADFEALSISRPSSPPSPSHPSQVQLFYWAPCFQTFQVFFIAFITVTCVSETTHSIEKSYELNSFTVALKYLLFVSPPYGSTVCRRHWAT
jgi:hypothetical protein